MSQERALLEAIAECPADEFRRLVYADWLEDRGDCRGEFIRLQLSYERLATDDDSERRSIELQKRAFLKDRRIMPLQADCLQLPDADPVELAVARLGIPLPLADSLDASPELARLTCAPFDFTNSVGMVFHLLPAGVFAMGDDKHAPPRHPVRISKPFYIAIHPVTQSEYEQVTGRNPSCFAQSGDGAEDVAGMDNSRFPVEQVNWRDAVAFCRKLTARDELEFSLPTEAQWEYACRAGSRTAYCFGEQEDRLGEYGVFGGGRKQGRPERVGSRKPNLWGLYDMHGNIYEWCQDGYDVYADAELAVDPTGKNDSADRIIRGGSWDAWGEFCGSANRNWETPNIRAEDLGFRVACPSG